LRVQKLTCINIAGRAAGSVWGRAFDTHLTTEECTMTALTRFTPFRSSARFDTPATFDDLFRNFGLAPTWSQPEFAADMRVDITEGDDAFHVNAEIPGVDKGNIEVAVDGNRVSIAAEAKREKEKKNEKELIVERSWGRAYRAFALPCDIDGNRTEARYDKGVLTLTLPKKATGNARRITVD
jgi:HSP20 family protein